MFIFTISHQLPLIAFPVIIDNVSDPISVNPIGGLYYIITLALYKTSEAYRDRCHRYFYKATFVSWLPHS